MPMPTDPTLADLAASAERDAAAGVKPALDWQWIAPLSTESSRLVLGSFATIHDESRFCTMRGQNGYVLNGSRFSCPEAAQLFAEALLRRATLALHPAPEPHVAAAVEVASALLGYATEFYSPANHHPDHVVGFLEECGLISYVDDGRQDDEGHDIQLTALGRALLNCGSPVEPADRAPATAPPSTAEGSAP